MKRTASIICALLVAFTALSQRYVPEDDIYYSPDDKDEIVEQVRKEREEKNRATGMTESSATKTAASATPVAVSGSNNFDVDAYNRRYPASSYDTAGYAGGDTIASYATEFGNGTEIVRAGDDIGDINYTELMKRFHNTETGTYILDPDYNTLYLVDDYGGYSTASPSSTNIYITGSSWYDPFYYPWGWPYGYNMWGWDPYWYPAWSWNASWYWNRPYYPYYPPRPPHHRPPGPQPEPSRPAYRPSGNYGGRYTPGGSVGTGGRTDGATRYEYTRPSGGSSTGIYSGNRTSTGVRTYGGRSSSGSYNRNSSISGGSYVRPSITPQNNVYRQSSPSSGGGMRSGAPAGMRSGGNIGGRGSR